MARALRHTPDRLLHAGRRRELQARLHARGVPRSILFICFGNICRSPYAALRMAQALPEELRNAIEISSAGFIGAGRPSPKEAVEVAAALGTDMAAHRSTPITPDAVEAADLVVVMDTVQYGWICQGFGRDPGAVMMLGDLDPERIDTRTVHDPVEQPAEVFREVYARIDRCVEALAALIADSAREKGSTAPSRVE